MTPRSAHVSSAGLIGALLLAGALVGLPAGCAAPAGDSDSGDIDVTLSVANEGATPLRCMLIFGHWVELDAGEVAAGARLDVALHRQSRDGALYVPRRDGRKMMLENLVCGPLEDWWRRRADIPLLPLRARAAPRFAATCRLGDGEGGRAHCTSPVPTP